MGRPAGSAAAPESQRLPPTAPRPRGCPVEFSADATRRRSTGTRLGAGRCGRWPRAPGSAPSRLPRGAPRRASPPPAPPRAARPATGRRTTPAASALPGALAAFLPLGRCGFLWHPSFTVRVSRFGFFGERFGMQLTRQLDDGVHQTRCRTVDGLADHGDTPLADRLEIAPARPVAEGLKVLLLRLAMRAGED